MELEQKEAPPKNTIELLKRLPNTVQVLIVGTVLNNFGNLVGPFLVIILVEKLKLSAALAGQLASVFGLAAVVSISLGGFLTDRLGRRNTLLLSLIGGGAISVILGVVESRSIFFILLIVFGLVTELYRPASLALFADLVPEKNRLTTLAFIRVVANFGLTASMIIGGYFIDSNWKCLFFIDGLTTLVYGFVVFLYISEPNNKSDSQWKSVHVSKSASSLSGPLYIVFLAGTFAYGMVYATHLSILPIIVTIHAKLSAMKLGVLLGYSCSLCILTEIWLTHQSARFSSLSVITTGTILVAGGLAASSIYPNWVWLLFMGTIWTIGEMLTISRLMKFAADYAPIDERGKYLSTWQSVFRLSSVVSPALFLWLYQSVSLSFVSWAIAGSGLLAAVIFGFLEVHSHKPA